MSKLVDVRSPVAVDGLDHEILFSYGHRLVDSLDIRMVECSSYPS